MAKKEKKLEHIQVKDNGIKLSNRVGDSLADAKQLIEKKYFEGLLKASDETSMVRYKIAQNNAFKQFKENTTSIIKEAKQSVNSSLKGDETVNLNNKQVKALTKDINNGLLYLQQDAINQYQRFISSVTYKVHAAGELQQQLSKHIKSGLDIGVIYKDGKHYNFDSYFEMKARTEIQKDIGQNMVTAGQESGVVFYISAFFGDCAPDHAELNGKLFCDEKWESLAPKDRVDEIRDYINSNKIMTIQEAMGEPYYYTTRPNCRHYFQFISIDEVLGAKTQSDVNKLREENALNFNGKYKPDKYKALQEQRLNERKIRAQKEIIQKNQLEQKLHPDDNTYQIKINNAMANIKGYQKAQRELIKQYDNLERRYDREKLGNRINLGVKNTIEEQEVAFPDIPKYVPIDADYKSDDYKQRVISLGLSKHESNMVIKGIKKIFNNEKSSEVEGIYAVDLKSKKSFYNGNGEPKSVNRPKELNEFLKENPTLDTADIIVIHNHRGNTIPSPSDLYKVSEYKSSNKGIVACNNGDLYFYKATTKIPTQNFIKYNEDDSKCGSMEERHDLLLKFCKENGIILVENKKGGKGNE